MKHLLKLLGLLFFASSALAQTPTPTPTATCAPPAFIQSINYRGPLGGGSNADEFPANLTTGRTIVCDIHIENGSATVTSVTDDASNTYADVSSRCLTDGSNRSVSMWRAANITGGTKGNVLVTLSSAVGYEVMCHEYSGLTTSPNDAFACGTWADDPTSGNITTTQAGDLLHSFTVNNGGNASPPSGYTSRITDVFNIYRQTADKIAGTAGTEAAQWTTAGANSGVSYIGSFKSVCAAPAPTATPTPGATPTNTPTATPTNTPIPPTATPTNTPTPLPTATPQPTPTIAPSPTASPSPTPTATIPPSSTLPPGYTPPPLVRFTPNFPFEPCDPICCIRSTCPSECGETFCEDLGLGSLMDPIVKECVDEKLEEAGC